MAVVGGPCDCGRMTGDAMLLALKFNAGGQVPKGTGGLKAGKGKEQDFSPASPERTEPLTPLILVQWSHVRPNYKRLHLFCFIPLSLW